MARRTRFTAAAMTTAMTTVTAKASVTAVTAAATAIAVWASAGGVAQAAERPVTAERRYGQAQLQRDLDAIHQAGASGVFAEVRIGGRRLRGTSGVADLDAGGPVPVNGYFRMGSNTKTFVSVVVLQLVREGRLSLEDTVDRWLPGAVSGNGNDGRAITVRRLLQHTSGLYNYSDDLVARIVEGGEPAYRELQFQKFTPRELVEMAVRRAPDFAPGQGWNYSNTNYVLLGLIIKKATGREWAREVRDRVIRPLGLRHTFAPGERTELPEPHAKGYLYLGPDHPMETSDASMTWTDAAGSLVTTASDLSRFWSAIGRGALLHPAQQAEMRRTVLATAWQEDEPGLRYGLGLEWKPLSCGGGYWTHNGDVPGYSTTNGVSADGRTTVVISMSTTAEESMHQAAGTAVDHVMCGR